MFFSVRVRLNFTVDESILCMNVRMEASIEAAIQTLIDVKLRFMMSPSLLHLLGINLQHSSLWNNHFLDDITMESTKSTLRYAAMKLKGLLFIAKFFSARVAIE